MERESRAKRSGGGAVDVLSLLGVKGGGAEGKFKHATSPENGEDGKGDEDMFLSFLPLFLWYLSLNKNF